MKRWKRAVALGVASAMLLFNLVAMAVEADELSFASAVVGENSVQDSGWTPPKIDLSVELDLDAEIVAITVSTDHYTRSEERRVGKEC